MSENDERTRRSPAPEEASDRDIAASPESGPPDSERPRGGGDKPPKRKRKAFPSPGSIDEPLRVNMSAKAHADIVAHANESLEMELCGVLVGKACEDDHGLWVSVEGAIRGPTDQQSGTHVTYTQHTWERIYEVKDRDYPALDIVGWYHTHPGFGVEFSEMDLFIQRNFFSAPSQIGLLIDHISGDEAICANTPSGSRYLSRFWVDGRQRMCRVPSSETAELPPAHALSSVKNLEERLERIEERLHQVLEATEEQRLAHSRLLVSAVMLVAAVVVLGIGVWIYATVTRRPRPPQLANWVPVPVQIGDKVVLLGVGIHRWEVPDELNAVLLQMAREQQERLERQTREKRKRRGSEGKAGSGPSKSPRGHVSPSRSKRGGSTATGKRGAAVPTDDTNQGAKR